MEADMSRIVMDYNRMTWRMIEDEDEAFEQPESD